MDEPTPLPVSVTPTAHAWLHRPTERTLLIVSGVLALVVSAIMLAAYLPFISFIIATQGTRFEVVQHGMPVWYEIDWMNARPVSGPAGYENAPVRVLEAVKYDSPVGDTAVLAQVPGTEGVAVGVLHADNTFTTVVGDTSSKAHLAVRPDGVALFSSMSDGVSHIMYTTLTKPGTVSNLGPGSAPRLAVDGFFVAMSPQGLVRIDPAITASSTSVLIPNSYAEKLFGAISPDGHVAFLPNAAGKTTLYSIERTSPATVPVIRVQNHVFSGPVGFVRSEYLTEVGARVLHIYALKNGEMRSVGALSVQ